MFQKEKILECAKNYDSFYFYDENEIIRATSTLKRNFEGVTFLYSMKANANPFVVQSVLSQGFGVDAASVAEVKKGFEIGVKKEQIQFSTTGKTRKNIEDTILNATLIADSFNEVLLIEEVAKEKNIEVEIGLRVNPCFSFEGGAGLSSKFGMDEEQIYENRSLFLSLKQVKIVGLHVHLQSQSLYQKKIEGYYKNVLDLAVKFQEMMHFELKFLNMGSCIGISYDKNDISLDLVQVGESISVQVRQLNVKFPSLKIYMETGRYAVGKSGVYVTKVLDKKVSRGKTFVILNNTLNGFIRPSMAELIKKYSDHSLKTGSEPLYTTENPVEFYVLSDSSEVEVVTLVGNLCTATDVVARDVTLTKMVVGDVVVMTNAGSYSAVLSPIQFSSLEQPKELFLAKSGEILL